METKNEGVATPLLDQIKGILDQASSSKDDYHKLLEEVASECESRIEALDNDEEDEEEEDDEKEEDEQPEEKGSGA